ncbi:hypothetical protein AAG570_004864 [Ranatra chinensis]|uniref:TBC1 domain family member 30 n=1 Tax=Ranatra chinensis TaxID=642074 RepID=A0ABD0YMC6_9HEMI
MKMVARLPDGIPAHFRKTLWLTLAEKHLASRNVNWGQAERVLFNESTNPDDYELSAQIVKDLHRTGCSLFCGATGQHNQALLKRVLLAYARWNKSVGYCQGLNMLAALILQVMQGSQSATVKVMIYLIEGVLPESYFANNLRGLSVDMAVFRDVLRIKLPDLSRHLDHLQHDSKESGSSYEPPLMDVFTMQWFLTIFSNCLPQPTVLRVWDLLFLEGNQILLRTALAIWQTLSEKMLAVRSADEFYSIMTVLAREMLEFGLMDANNLIKAIDTLTINEVNELREKYVFNITPWTVATVAKKGLKLLYPDPYDSDDDHFQSGSSSTQQRMSTPFSNHPDREKIALDISLLKKQYSKLRERQRQAHIIFTACGNDNLNTTSSPALNHLLLGKSALLTLKGRRIQGAVPPPRVSPKQRHNQTAGGDTLHWKDAARGNTGGECDEGTSRHPGNTPPPSSSSTSASSSSASSPSPGGSCESHREAGDVSVAVEESLSAVSRSSPVSCTSDSSTASSSSSSSTELCDDSSAVPSEDDGSAEGRVTQDADSNGDSPLPCLPRSPDSGRGGHHQRRDSELALMQILQENSQILERIRSSSCSTAIGGGESQFSGSGDEDRFPGEPDDIREIRKKYDRIISRQASCCDALLQPSSSSSSWATPATLERSHSTGPSPGGARSALEELRRSGSLSPTKPSTAPTFNPFPTRTSPRRRKEVAVKLGLYSSTSEDAS